MGFAKHRDNGQPYSGVLRKVGSEGIQIQKSENGIIAEIRYKQIKQVKIREKDIAGKALGTIIIGYGIIFAAAAALSLLIYSS